MHFGLWITLSSALTFLSGEGARLLMGKLLDVRLLAMNSLAGALCWTVAGVIQSMAGRVFHPVYAEVLRASPERFAEVVHKSRRVQVAAVWGSCLFFLLLGKPLIDFLYDKRYADAAVMLQIQSLGLMIGVLSTSYSSVLLSMGRMGLGSVIQFCQIIVNISFMLVGHHVAGPFGVVAFGTLSGWALYPVTAFIYKKLGLWKASIDLPVLLATLLASLLYAYSEQWRPALAW
jgi:O-antigen/teichoic acid export membrane protein